MQPVVIGTGIGGAMLSMADFIEVATVWSGEFGYITLAPAEKLNNWSQLASTCNMVRYVIEKSGRTDCKIYQEAEAGNALCQEAIRRMNRNRVCLISVSHRPRCH